MKRLISLILALSMIFTLAACANNVTDTGTKNEDKKAEKTEGAPAATEHADIEVYVTYNGEKFISYNESTPFTTPDGKVYKKGDLLPTWEYMGDALNLSIVDKTPKSGSKEDLLLKQAAATKFEDANMFVGSPRTLSDYGIQGYFIPLNEYFDKLPNFKAFLDANPTVTATLTQADGNIYFTPYFDDVNELERMFLMRLDWVKAILDEEAPGFDTQKKIETVYEAFYDYAGGKTIQVGEDNKQTFDIKENIIDIQNKLSVKDGANLAQALRDYIDENYMNDKTGYKNRSDLFISSSAAYDADELIALMRAVKANPVYLTGEDKDLTIFSQRRVKDVDKVRMLAVIWGIRGVDSRNEFYFLDKNGSLVDARMDDDYLTGLENMHKLYEEGLILQDFDQAKGQVSDFRKLNFQTNDGFITYDYAASTVALHDLIPAEDLEKYGTVFEPVVSAAAPWFSDEFEHYSEGNRSVKTKGGWGIASHTKGAKLDAALRLIDYPFSPEGLNVLSFGPKGLYWNELVDVNGKKVPKLIEQFKIDRDEYASGNWSNFMRGFVGATFGIGHLKQTIALETQVSNEHYANGLSRIAKSPTTLASLSTSVPPERRVVPTILPLNEDQVEALSVNTFKAYYLEWQTRIIKYGFGAKIPNSSEAVPTREAFVQALKDKGIELETRVMNQAYTQ